MQEIRASDKDLPVTDMSASYHEIFDTQLMASVAGLDLRGRDQDQDEDDEDVVNARLGGPLQSLDNNTASTTEYLTSKLVEDSLKWQKECSSQLPPAQDSSKNSPAKKRPQTLLQTTGCVMLKWHLLIGSDGERYVS